MIRSNKQNIKLIGVLGISRTQDKSNRELLYEVEQSPLSPRLSDWLEANIDVYRKMRQAYFHVRVNERNVELTLWDYINVWMKPDTQGIPYWFNKGMRNHEYVMYRKDLDKPFSSDNVGISKNDMRFRWRIQEGKGKSTKFSRVRINGKEYLSAKDASKALNITYQTIFPKLNSSRYPDWIYLNKARGNH